MQIKLKTGVSSQNLIFIGVTYAISIYRYIRIYDCDLDGKLGMDKLANIA